MIRIPSSIGPDLRATLLDVQNILSKTISRNDVLTLLKQQARAQSSSGSDQGNDFVGRVTVDGPLYVSGNVGIGKDPGYQLELSTDSAAKPTTNTWTVPSDGRAKEHVEDFTDGLDKIRRLRPVTYEYNGRFGTPTGSKGVGVVAQEARSVIPNSVSELSFYGEKYLGFNTHEVLFLLINAVKELDARLTALEAK